MKEEISNLVKLQTKDDEIRALEGRLAEIPKEVQALEREIATEKKNLKAAEDALAEGEKAQRSAEGELSDTEQKLSKYQDQLMNVKSNVEYKTMQHQIEATRADIGNVETRILEGLDSIEVLNGRRNERKAELHEGQTRVAAMEKELDEERKKLEAELAERQQAREDVLKLVPEGLFEEYTKIAGTRAGVAMAAAVEERCQVCMVRIRPQVFVELKLGETMHRCRSCQRILYFMEPDEASTT